MLGFKEKTENRLNYFLILKYCLIFVLSKAFLRLFYLPKAISHTRHIIYSPFVFSQASSERMAPSRTQRSQKEAKSYQRAPGRGIFTKKDGQNPLAMSVHFHAGGQTNIPNFTTSFSLTGRVEPGYFPGFTFFWLQAGG